MSGAAQTESRWRDLRTRTLSALVMLVVFVGATYMGGMAFRGLIALCVGAMLWELWRMVSPSQSSQGVAVGAIGAGAQLALPELSGSDSFIVMCALALWLVVPAAMSALLIKRLRLQVAAYAVAITLAGIAFTVLESVGGWIAVATFAGIVVVTDVAGYFAGRSFGGPKFWPRISPKKTWSGVIAGWICAMAYAGLIAIWMRIGAGEIVSFVLPVAFAVSLASQMGDIAESAIKRQAGVKDSSNLIPGHGGVLDRFDGMIGMGLVVLVVIVIFIVSAISSPI